MDIYKEMYKILEDAVADIMPQLTQIHQAKGIALAFSEILANKDIETKQKYSILCGAISDSIDIIDAEVPDAKVFVPAMLAALEKAEDLFAEWQE